jgi:predicted patatin/cPLA2 family phospholipase
VHPVLDLLAARARGARDDGATLALVIEGGGMRGVVSAAMAAALEARGLTPCFDLVAGTSAGALTGAALLAGVAAASAASYYSAFTTRRFINPYRLVIGRAAVDVAFTLRYSDTQLDAERHARTAASPIALHCVAVDVETAAAVDLTGFASADELCAALLASTRLPWLGGDPAEYRGRRFLDGGLAQSIPYGTALEAGATHALVLQTRPWGVARTPPGGLADRIIRRRLKRLNPALVELWRQRPVDYEHAVAEVAEHTERPTGRAPWLYGLRLPEGGPVIGQLERRAGVLEDAAGVARAYADEVLAAALG